MIFHIYHDHAKEYRWRLKAKNGKIIADSAEGYVRKNDIISTINLIKRFSSAAEIEDDTLISLLSKLLKK